MSLPPRTDELPELDKWALTKYRGYLEGLVVEGSMTQGEADAKYDRLAEGMREGGLQHALALGATRPATEEVQLLQTMAQGGQNKEAGGLPATARLSGHRGEAERPDSPRRQRSVIGVFLHNTNKIGEGWTTTNIQRGPRRTDPLRLSVCGKERTPSSDREEESQTRIEDANLDVLIPGADGRANHRGRGTNSSEPKDGPVGGRHLQQQGRLQQR